MKRAISFLILYIAALLPGTSLFVGGITLIKSCRQDAASILCDAFRLLGGALSVVVISAISLLAIATCDLWLINRRLVELGEDPRKVSAWTKLLRSSFLLSLVFATSKK